MGTSHGMGVSAWSLSFTIFGEWVCGLVLWTKSNGDPRFAWLTINIVFGVDGETGKWDKVR